MNSKQLNDFINQLTIILNQNTVETNGKHLIIVPVGIESIKIQFSDIYPRIES